jgi:drug/metabolite transporter (DMT)-like permease
VVYPIARGTGPIFSVASAMLLLGEQPSLGGGIGVVAVLSGVFISAGGTSFLKHRNANTRRAGVFWGLLTGLHIASYTIIDGWAIKNLGMSPVLFYAVGLAARTILLTPFVVPLRADLGPQWRAHRGAILVVGLLSPLAYTLVLLAVQIAPLSYVAPVREVSMLIGTVIGARLLGEKLLFTQVIGAGLMLSGVVFVALA